MTIQHAFQAGHTGRSVRDSRSTRFRRHGEVYRAKDLKLGREVAIKVLRAEWASDPERLKRFELEARSASGLNHPNLITIYDIGQVESTPYIRPDHAEIHGERWNARSVLEA